jgi:predicted patatin/cPLA2 family phospholipase
MCYVFPLHQLSFSGGGSFGAVEIGILKRLIEMEPKKYDLYTGISAGALNAGFLSYYSNVKQGINDAEDLYSSIRTKTIYTPLPPTGISLFNTLPLKKTLTDALKSMKNQPIVHTLIGTTNLYTGELDIYNFEDQTEDNKVLLMMASSAIPGLFPPIEFNKSLYADGGTLSNELIEVEHDKTYLNITFITPYEDYIYDDVTIKNMKDMLCRTLMIVSKNFNNPLTTMNQNCKTPIGEINKYYVPSAVLKNYNILNFDKCSELIDIGYHNVLHKKYNIC